MRNQYYGSLTRTQDFVNSIIDLNKVNELNIQGTGISKITRLSEVASSELVASSRASMAGFFRRARAMAKR